ncbi:MAG: tRNA pseudouridine(55) synthase TruB [Streptosporangiales bacterium]|nr:tRNA pseudouridine(55) synthase TruB [Streptosporangiales bacterium]
MTDAGDGLVVVDKPAGWTSHDVVGRMRRIAGTRRVGHAGTLDPMATGVLVVGVGRATRLLGRLALTDKEYAATIRLGVATSTDDAEGAVVATASAAEVDEGAVRSAMAKLTGTVSQVPSAVSAVKVGGRRAYERVRAGEQVELAARDVTVSRFDLLAAHRGADGATLDADVHVECTTGTYVRALARDLGAALGVGGHLTRLRRTRVGPFVLAQARTLEQLAERLDLLPIGAAAALAFPTRTVDAATAGSVAHGGRLPATGQRGPVAVFAPDGTFLALVEDRDGLARPLAVFAPGA